jgi:phage-related protein
VAEYTSHGWRRDPGREARYLDLHIMQSRRPIEWLPRTRKDFLDFPGEVRGAFEIALRAAQTGGRASNTKIWRGTGGGTTLEIIENHRGDAYRAVYTVRFPEVVYVLHVFNKKSKTGIKTPREDVERIEKQLRLAERLYTERHGGHG